MVKKLMKKNFMLVICFLTIVLLSFGNLVKAETDLVEYNLEDIVEHAIENNLDFKSEKYQFRQNQALYNQARAGRQWRSDLLFDLSYQQTSDLLNSVYTLAGEDELDDTYYFGSGTIAFSRILFDSIENKADLQRAELLVQESEQQLRVAEIDLLIEVLENSYQLFEAQNGVELATAALEQRENELARVEIEKEEDRAVATDVEEARLEVSKAERTLREAKDLLNLAENNLAQLSGIENLTVEQLQSPNLTVAEIPDKANPWPWDLDRMQEIALEQRPEIKRSELAKELAEIDLAAAEAEQRPNLNLSSNYFLADQNLRLGFELDEEYRLLATLSRIESSLPELEGFEFDEEFWEDIFDDFDNGFPFPDDSSINAQNVESQNSSNDINYGLPGDDNWQISFSLNYNLFDSGLVEQRINENEFKLEEAELTYQNARENIRLDVENNYQELKTAYQELRNLKLDYNLTQQRYDEMAILLEEDMASEREKELLELLLLRTETDLENAFYDYELDKAEIAAVLGFSYEWVIDYLHLR